ncbi:3-hydroxyacyl-CoA dehydrogenase [Echinicola strongylocentroti]|nr:3-hydroxyacyl-CoA dehydrogenase [Echinicola strongylocentroti]
MKQITIAGAGTLGSQIAWQAAFCGFEVTVFDVFEEGIERGKKFHESHADHFIKERNASPEEVEKTKARLSYTTNLEDAIKDADLLNESVPEKLEIKKSFYRDVSKLAPKKTIFTTNSSTLIPSQIAEAVDRPDKFLALHFANGIWDSNIGEVMGHPGTDPEIFKQVEEFAKAIGMVPIPIHKEQNGYVFNSLLVPFLNAAIDLVAREVSDPESIDKTWMIGNRSQLGPCAFIDIIGMETAYNVNQMWGEQLQDDHRLALAAYIKENFIDKGKMGVSSGEGFYSYPNPSYKDPGFLIK